MFQQASKIKLSQRGKISFVFNFSDTKFMTLFRGLALLYLVSGFAYLSYRLLYTLNTAHLFFSVCVLAAEIVLFVGSLFRIYSYWSPADILQEKPAYFLSEIKTLAPKERDRPLKIDVYITTYNEERALVEETVMAATSMIYGRDQQHVCIYLLDDGQRDGTQPGKENFKALAEEYGIRYLSRSSNIGFKAGNLNHGILNSSGDLFLILDADAKPFSNFLLNTTGYFRNKKLAWVQTPQWYEDLTPDAPLIKNTGFLPGFLKKELQRWNTGKDIFCSNPKIFYDIILRRRQKHNAVFSCGAGSLYRREAVMQHALSYQQQEIARKSAGNAEKAVLLEKEIPLLPFQYHISEDLYNSMLMHANEEKWQSVYHPAIESTMLSPQDLHSWVKQQERYASGTISMAFHKHNPLWLKGLSIRQRIAYFSLIYSFFTPLFSVFLFATPILYFFSFISPFILTKTSLLLFAGFQVLNILTFLAGNHHVSTKRFDQKYWASFWYVTRCWIKVLSGKKLRFNVTPKKKILHSNNFLHVLPHLLIMACTLTGIVFNLVMLLQHQHPAPGYFALFGFLGLYNIFQLNAFIRAAFV